jgi:C4-dicarboxylate-specific signal transduction histidine kinase
MLNSKLKAGVTVLREYADDLPTIQAYASELNQVWTNLMDNAVDAMAGQGTLIIRARRTGEMVEVEVQDDGLASQRRTSRSCSTRSSRPSRRVRGPGSDLRYPGTSW